MKKIVIILSLLLFFQGSLKAQEEIVVEYRVTAIKKGDSSIKSESNIITALPPLNIYIPNAFTPNNDGLNDKFGALGHGVENYNMKIFNRWGELLFESNNFNDQWDGYYKGKKVLSGNYIYEINASGFYDRNFHKSGVVTIIKS